MAIVPLDSKKKGTRYKVQLEDSNGDYYPTLTFDTRRAAEAYDRYLKGFEGSFSQHHLTRKINLRSYWDYWSTECRSKTSEGWKMSQNQMWRDYIEPVLGSYYLIDIRSNHIRHLMNALRDKGLSNQTILHVFNLLNKMLNDAVENEPKILKVNPISRKDRPHVVETEREFLNPSDARKLLETAKDDFLSAAVWLGLLAALRCEAIQALKVGRIDFDKRQILICEAFKRKEGKIVSYPKGKRHEYVPIPPRLLELLREKLRDKSALDFAVTGERGEMLSYNSFLRGVTRLCKVAGVKRITPHELRHSATELWIENGASEEDIRRLLHHRKSETTRKYMHRTDERLMGLSEGVGDVRPNSFTGPMSNKMAPVARLRLVK